MNKDVVKSTILVVLFVVLAPLILVGFTELGNAIGVKSNNTTTQQNQAAEQAAKVPEESKATNTNIPKANEEKVNSDSSSNNSNSQNSDTVSTTPIAGQSYVVKNGDTLFAISSSAYGEANAQNGVDKIKEANNFENNNLVIGQKIQIPKL